MNCSKGFPSIVRMDLLAGILSMALMLTTDFTATQTVVVPENNNKKVVYSQKPAKPNPVFQAMGNGIDGVGKGLGNTAQGTAKGAGWFFQELLRPVEALRTGLIDTFGVKESSGHRQR